jgi:hypothetical protein
MQDILASISYRTEQDIIVFCEDDVAESIIKHAVNVDLRRRLKMVKGSKTKLLAYAEAHVRAGWPQILAVIWDGDVEEKEIEEWRKTIDDQIRFEINNKVSFIQLPGREPPERWIVSVLANSDEGIEMLAKDLNDDPMQTRSYIGILHTMEEPHAIAHALAEKTGLDEQPALDTLLRTLKQLSTKPLDTLNSQLERIAKGEIFSDISKTELK